jgi:hypothetical protein
MLSFAQIFDQLEKQEAGKLPLWSGFRPEITQRTSAVTSNPPGWEAVALNERAAATLIQSAIAILEEMATRFAHTTDDPVYEEATNIAQGLHCIIAAAYGFQPCTIRIMSPTRQLEAAGLVKVERGSDGELYVQPNP